MVVCVGGGGGGGGGEVKRKRGGGEVVSSSKGVVIDRERGGWKVCYGNVNRQRHTGRGCACGNKNEHSVYTHNE